MRKILFIVLAALALCVLGVFLRAALLAPHEVPVLFYRHVAEYTHGQEDTVSSEAFYLQLRNLAADGFDTLSPAQVTARKWRGARIPTNSFVIWFDAVTDAEAKELAPMLHDLGMSAWVASDLPPAALEANADKDARRAGEGPEDEPPPPAFLRVPAGFTLDPDRQGQVMMLGMRTNFSRMPFIPVVGGDPSFGADAILDDAAPGRFGWLRITQPTGPRLAFSVVAYGRNDDAPLVQRDVNELAPEASVALQLPADVEFPLSVFVYDPSRYVSYFETIIPRSSAHRDASFLPSDVEASEDASDAEVEVDELPDIEVEPDSESVEDVAP